MLGGMRDWGYDSGSGLAQRAADTQPLDGATAMGLLACVDCGRLAFSTNSLPAIRPVNHVVDDGRIIIRTSSTGAISAAARSIDGVMVAYEADKIDAWGRTGWSVIVTGRARTVTDPDQVSRYQQLLQPWVDHADTVVAIEPEIVTGRRVIAPLS